MIVRPLSGTGYLDDALTIEQSKEVFANFGLAVHASNVLEYAVLNALFVVEVMAEIRSYKDEASWHAAYDTFFDRGFSQPFGTLLSRLKNCGKYSLDLIEMLEACKKVRNHLVHHSQREGAEAIYSDLGRKELIESYENAVSLFEAANDQIEIEIASRQEAMGMDMTLFAKRVEEAMQQLVDPSIS